MLPARIAVYANCKEDKRDGADKGLCWVRIQSVPLIRITYDVYNCYTHYTTFALHALGILGVRMYTYALDVFAKTS